MTRSHRIVTAALTLLLPVAAQAGPISNREARQQHRIGQGLESGQITANGAQHLEAREARINAARTRDLAANGGHLTSQERHNLNHREDNASHAIYRDKHNDIAQPGVTPVGTQN